MKHWPFDRGTSETLGVAVLVGVTVITVASVGLSVTLVSDSKGNDASFNFDYQEGLESILISYTSGDKLVAGNLVIEGPDGQVTWAEESDFGPEERIEPGPPGSQGVVVGESSEYGSKIAKEDYIEVRYTPPTEDGEEAEAVVLGSWNSGENDGDDVVDVPTEE